MKSARLLMVVIVSVFGMSVAPNASAQTYEDSGTSAIASVDSLPPCPPGTEYVTNRDGTIGMAPDAEDNETGTYAARFRPDDDGPPSPSGPGGSPEGGAGPQGSGFTPFVATNGLWLQMDYVTNGVAYSELMNGTDYVYAIVSTTNPLLPWNVEAEVFPGTNTNACPFTISTEGRGSLFLWAFDWTGITSNGNETPDWWIWEYFGTTALSDTNVDAAGNTLLYDYEHGNNPNIIFFNPVFPNIIADTTNTTAEIQLVAGFPAKMAYLVGTTNFSSAEWEPWSSNITVVLGPTNGIYDVWIGLQGFSTNSQTWMETYLPFYQAPLSLTVTNLLSDLVTQSSIQLLGYSQVPLSGLTCDISNSMSVLTNVSGSLAGGYYNSNLLTYTTNYFQFNNILLSPGRNNITLHAHDLDGNSFTTNLTVTYELDTNPPVVFVIWPSNNLTISGSSMTLQASVNDPTTTIQASANGVGVIGTVEQSGMVWLPGIPLGAGTNYITINATNVAGKSSTTELTVIQSTVGLTINPIETNQLGQLQITVTGTVSVPSDQVWANGIQATVNGDGTWEADNVIVSPNGTAVITAQAGPSSSNIVASQTFTEPQPVRVTLENTIWDYQLSGYSTGCGWSAGDVFNSHDNSTLNWNSSSGGEQNWWQYGLGGDGNYNNHYYQGLADSPPPSVWIEADVLALVNQGGCGSNFVTGPIVASSKVVIEPQGQTQAGTMNLYLVSASAMEYSDPQGIVYGWGGDTPLPPQWLQIQGEPLTSDITTNGDGSVWGSTLVLYPAGVPADVTPVAIRVYTNNMYSVNVTAQPISLSIAATVSPQTNSILLSQTNPTFCVGQQLTFLPVFSPPLPANITNIVYNWTLPDAPNFVNSVFTNSGGCANYTNNSVLFSNANQTCWYVNGTGGTATLGVSIIMPNGKSLTLAALGQFSIVRPHVTNFIPPDSLQVQFVTNRTVNVSAPLTVEAQVEVPSNFTGIATYAQLFEGSNYYYTDLPVVGCTHSSQNTGGQYELDNSYPYSKDNPINLSWTDNPTKYVAHNDTPGLDPGSYPFCTSLSITDAFRTYLIFQPPSGIWVTLGRIDWSWSCIATESNGIWSYTAVTNQPTTNFNDSSFPLWTNIYNND